MGCSGPGQYYLVRVTGAARWEKKDDELQMKGAIKARQTPQASPRLPTSQVDDSSNGTWVNDARAVRGRPTQLKSGDHVSLCAPPAERDTKAVCFTFTGYWSGD